jgi:bacterial/archaeal transporter family protein
VNFNSAPKWLVYALICCSWWGIFGFLSKVGSMRLRPQQMLAIFILGMLPPVLLAWWREGMKIETDRLGVICGLLIGLLGNLGQIAFFAAMRVGQASIVGPVTSLFPVLSVILAIIFLRERMNPAQIAGVVLAVASVIILSL